MNKKLIIITIPGIGTKLPGYTKRFEKKLAKFTKGTNLANNYELVRTRPFNATNIDENQKSLFKRIDKKNRLGGIFSLRKEGLYAFGDAVTFEHNNHNPKSVYQIVHNYLKKEIEEANRIGKKYDKYKIVIVAASMGCHVLSTYIWDADNNIGIFSENHANEDNNLKNLDYLATIGCNIPLFISGLSENEIKPIKKRNQGFVWDNFYDPNDILGWPLKNVCEDYNKLVRIDKVVNTGLYVGSHIRYWHKKSFVKPFVSNILKIYDSF